MWTEPISRNGLLTLGLLEVSGVGPVGARRLLTRLKRDRVSAAEVLERPDLLLSLLSAERMEQFEHGLESAEELAIRLGEMGGRIVSLGDAAYPERLHLLGNSAPLYVTILGNERLLGRKGVGFCGSRKASATGLSFAGDLGRELGKLGINLISGYAAGVDTEVHQAALEVGGTTTIVLPLGIAHFRLKADLEGVWDWERVLVVSQFPFRLPWQARNAMTRNSTICGLSDALIVVEAGETGGTLAAGKTGLNLGIPVLVTQASVSAPDTPGNRSLIELGASTLVRADGGGGEPNVRDVIQRIQRSERGHPSFL